MRNMLLASAAALALLVAVPALAAPDDHHDHAAGGGGQQAQGHSGGSSGGRHDQNVSHGAAGAGTQGGHGGGGAGVTNNAPPGGTTTGQTRTHAGRGHNSAFDTTTQGGMSAGNGGRHGTAIIFGTGGHGFKAAPGRHVDHNSAQIQQLRANRSASRHFHAGSYNGPRGYSYRRWSYGDFLPALYFTNDYWLNDYSDYDLPYAPPGTIWVRYGDDALLVDRYTGEIITVEYGLFD
jgi:Ni/Co efflux regulator RcnB